MKTKPSCRMSHSQPPVRWWTAPSSSTYQPAFLTFRTKKPACCFTRTTWNWLLSLSWLYPIPDCMPYAWLLINTVQIETWSCLFSWVSCLFSLELCSLMSHSLHLHPSHWWECCTLLVYVARYGRVWLYRALQEPAISRPTSFWIIITVPSTCNCKRQRAAILIAGSAAPWPDGFWIDHFWDWNQNHLKSLQIQLMRIKFGGLVGFIKKNQVVRILTLNFGSHSYWN